MNKKLLITAVFISFAVLVFACLPKAISSGHANTEKIITSEEGIQFVEADWNKAVQEAKKQKKLIFIDAYTSWCGPCRMLKQKTFTDKAAGEYFNSHFINIALDMEKGDGLAFAEKYQIRAYPTLLIMDADQTSVSVSEGYINPGQLIEFGKYVVNKLPKIK